MKRSDISDFEVCKAVHQYRENMSKIPLFSFASKYVKFPYQVLAEKFNCDKKLAYSACERACDNDLIEYGVSLRTGWLTEKGKELLSPSKNKE